MFVPPEELPLDPELPLLPEDPPLLPLLTPSRLPPMPLLRPELGATVVEDVPDPLFPGALTLMKLAVRGSS